MRASTLSTIPLLCAVSGLLWGAPGPDSLGQSAALLPPTAIVSGNSAMTASTGMRPALFGIATPVAMPVADELIVRKSERRLYLMRGGQVLRSYRVALGLVPEGAKDHSGDFRTPEGRYYLGRRNPRSDYFLSIQVSYPNDQDLRRARREHVDPGGSIMLHGLPNSLRHGPGYYAKSDWTDGCIAMSDSDMVEVWLMTRDNTPIDILP